MQREELAGPLRQPYSSATGYGVEKIVKPGYENIWFVVPPGPPRTISEKLELSLVRDANLALQGRPRLSAATDNQRTTAYLLARREAVASSRMEGTWSTIDDVLSPVVNAVSRSATASVRGYANAMGDAMEAVRRDGIAALTSDLLCRLHEQVMEKDPRFNGVAGRLRTPGLPGDVVQIGGIGRKEDAIYNPAPPSHVKRCLEETLEWMRDESLLELGDAGMGMSLPIRMAIGHAHFEAVHPFSDGNGRIGRMLWSIQMAAYGVLPLYLSGYVEANRSDYGEALEQAQKCLSYRRIVEFTCKAIVASSDEESESTRVLQRLPQTWQERGAFRRASTAARALELLVRMPIVSARILASELKVSAQAANQALQRLEDAGVVKERSGRGRGRIYSAEEVTGVLARSFATDPEAALEAARRRLSGGGELH